MRRTGKEEGLKQGIPLNERNWRSYQSQPITHAFFTGVLDIRYNPYSYLVIFKAIVNYSGP